MKKAWFKESQIVAILKEADAGILVGDVMRKHYNAARPHSSLEHQTPLEFVSQWKFESTTEASVSR